MAEQDSFSQFDFTKVGKAGKYLKFEAGKPVTVRILTKDPIVQERTFEGDGEINISTKFCFIVWNFTDEKAQIMSVTGKMAKTLQKIGLDEDYGSNLQNCDIKISPEGEKLQRVYDINVLRHSGNEKELTQAQIKECAAIDLDNDVQDNKGRLSKWTPKEKEEQGKGYAEAQAIRDQLGNEDIEDEPINLEDIPF